MEKGRILLSVTGFAPQRWYELLSAAREVVLEPDGPQDPSIAYAVAWRQKPGVLARLPNLRAIFSIGAGVDHLFADPKLPDVPIVRVVAEGLTGPMTEYLTWRVLAHHRQEAAYLLQQKRRIWRSLPQRPAGDVAVGIMGIGHLGQATARALKGLGFRVNGWSRTPKTIEGVATWHGESGLTPFLNATDFLVVLLPLTPDTRAIIDYRLLRQLRRREGGAVLINAGRGLLQKDADIAKALEDGTLSEASLDVFEVEPLPRTSPLWNHPKVFVTPHVAAESDPALLVPQMLAQMDAFERGEPLANVVDRQAGY